MSGMILHQFEVSPFAAKVRRALRYKGLEFEVRNYGVGEAGLIRRTVSPTGKTPVLQHAGRLVVDSSAILRYLEHQFPQPSIVPTDPREKALAHVLEDWADESLFFYDLAMRGWPHNIDSLIAQVLSHDRGMKRWLLARLLPSAVARIGNAQGIGRKDHETVCREVEVQFDSICALLDGRNFLVNDALTVADIAVAAMCTVMEYAREAAEMMRARPQLMAWRERVDQLCFAPQTRREDRVIS